MRNIRAILMIAVAVIAGLAAVVLAGRWLSERSSVATSKVAVAAVELNIGQRIGAQQVRLIDWPAGSVPAGAFTSADAIDGRVTRTSIQRDEPLLESKLAPRGATGGLSSFIGQGKRAITVRVNDVVGVAGFALPGNYVDIVLNTVDESAGGSGKEQSVSKIMLEKILVLAVAQETSRDDTKPRVVNAVTLEVMPQEAELIDLARSVGTLSLVLRNQTDSAANKTTGVTKELLLGRRLAATAAPTSSAAPRAQAPMRVAAAPRQQEPAKKESPPRRCIDTFVGAERVAECF